MAELTVAGRIARAVCAIPGIVAIGQQRCGTLAGDMSAAGMGVILSADAVVVHVTIAFATGILLSSLLEQVRQTAAVYSNGRAVYVVVDDLVVESMG